MTKTDAENAPSDALTAWRKAFFTRNVKAFAEGFAQNVVLEASTLRKSVEGRDRVRQMLWTAAEIYESLVFTDQASSGQRISIEWGATAFGGKQLRGSTILVTNEEGKIDHAVVQHHPLDGLLAGAGVIVALMGAVAVAATLAWAADARVIVIRASLVLVVSVGVTVLAVALGSAVGLYAGSVLACLGFGPAFSSVFRSLAQLAPPDKRAGLLASIFIVVYLAFGLPALIAGVAVTHFGLRDTTYGYGIMVMALAAMTALAIWRRRVRSATVV